MRVISFSCLAAFIIVGSQVGNFLQANATTTTTVVSPSLSPLGVEFVDILARDNLERHHTSKYGSVGKLFVLRRGEPMKLVIHLTNERAPTQHDKVRLELSYGVNPRAATSLENGSLVYLPLPLTLQTQPNNGAVNNNNQDSYNRSVNSTLISPEERARRADSSKWNAFLDRVDTERGLLYAQIMFPCDMAIGVWRLKITTKVVVPNLQNFTSPSSSSSSTMMQSFAVQELIYVLFNAWNEHDDVYLFNEQARQEYVLNEIGKIYIGTVQHASGREWNYGQFDGIVLPTVLQMLDKTRLTFQERSNVVRVSRAVSALINSHDEGGLLVGNWSGNYGDATSPWQWTGSAPVFKKYLNQGYRSVRYGQCWVFGGTTTTTLRTLGIPARTITNFVSAHDTDSSLTVDKFHNSWGAVEGVNGDSIWNFHVWSDAWMQRRDLPPGYGGWQAIDATPQEQSMGVYQLGPASLEAIKQGKVGYAYDVAFVFSEVNARVVYWQLDPRSRLMWRKTRVQHGHMGRKMLTKTIGALDRWSANRISDAEDIVNQYKYPEGSQEARSAQASAATTVGVMPLYDRVQRRR